MKEDILKSEERTYILKQAEKALKGKTTDLKKPSSGDAQSLVHELEVQQIELEMQNEELRRIQNELEDMRNRYSDLYDFAPIGYFTFDKNGFILQVNLAGAKKLGRERSYLIKKPFSLYIASDYKDTFYSHLKEVFNTEKQMTCELRLVETNGNIFDAKLESIPVRDSDGNLQARTAMSDITERKRTEKLSQEARRYAESIIETVREPFVALDKDLKVLSANRSFYSSFEVTPDETVGYLIYNIGNRQWDIPSLRTLLEEILPKKTEFLNYEVSHKFQTIGQKIMLLNARQVYQEVTSTPIILLAIEDITQRKKAEAELHKLKEGLELKVKERTRQLEIEIEMHKKSEDALAESEQMYRAIFENTGTATMIIEEDTTISMANSIFERISGYSKEEVEGKKSWTEFVIKEDLERMKKDHKIRRTDPKKAPLQYEFSFVDKNGIVKCAFLSIAMMPGNKKSVASIIDITERKRAEQELLLAKEEAERASHVKSEFLSTVSHELKTPLVAIMGFSSLLKNQQAGELNEKEEHYVDGINRGGTHLLCIINNILDMVRVESGEKISLSLDLIPAPELIDEILVLVNEKASKKKISIKKEIEPGLGFIKADKIRFRQILNNLLDNAIKFSKPEGGTVTIDARKDGDMVRFSISDTGIGIREEDIGKVFDMFHQIDSGLSRKYGGTGIGLAVTKQLVEQHGGRIWVESKYDKGSTFMFTLPHEVKKK